MKIEVRLKGLPPERVARERIRRRLRLAVGSFAERVERVSVTLEELERSSGEPESRCRIRLLLAEPGDPLLVEDVDREALVALDRAARRIARGVSRRLRLGRRTQSRL